MGKNWRLLLPVFAYNYDEVKKKIGVGSRNIKQQLGGENFSIFRLSIPRHFPRMPALCLLGGSNSVAECQLPKLNVASSILVSRSNFSGYQAHLHLNPRSSAIKPPRFIAPWQGVPQEKCYERLFTIFHFRKELLCFSIFGGTKKY